MHVALMLKYWYTHAILAMKCSDLVTALAMSSQYRLGIGQDHLLQAALLWRVGRWELGVGGPAYVALHVELARLSQSCLAVLLVAQVVAVHLLVEGGCSDGAPELCKFGCSCSMSHGDQ